MIEQTIWLDGTRFRVRDEAGRDLYEILGDATARRGLGLPAKSMEDIMDRRKAASRPSPGPTEIYGNLADDVGWVYPPRAARWAKPARELAPVATQILAVDRPGSLNAAGAVTRLGRPATEYRGVVTVDDDGQRFDSAIDCVVALPFLLHDQVRDPGSAEHYYTREVLDLAPGAVTAADLEPHILAQFRFNNQGNPMANSFEQGQQEKMINKLRADSSIDYQEVLDIVDAFQVASGRSYAVGNTKAWLDFLAEGGLITIRNFDRSSSSRILKSAKDLSDMFKTIDQYVDLSSDVEFSKYFGP